MTDPLTPFQRLMLDEQSRVVCGDRWCEGCVACTAYQRIIMALEDLLPEAIDTLLKEKR